MNMLYSVRRGGGYHFVAKVTKYKGTECLELRHYVEKDGAWVATKKGINLSLSYVPDLAQALTKLADQLANEKGAE